MPQSAADYFKQGIELSVKEYDKLAELNKIPYYDNKYDEKEATLKLTENEISDLLANADYQLSGFT